MATRDIRTFHESVVCDMCGRTLLRGEHAETYLAGGSRREVCDLCADRALHEGWIREDTRLDSPEPSGRAERGRSLFGRLRQRRAERAARAPEREPEYEPPPDFMGRTGAGPDDEDEDDWVDEEPAVAAAPPSPAPSPAPEPEPEPEPELLEEPEADPQPASPAEPPPRPSRRVRRTRREPQPASPAEPAAEEREARSIRAVPTSAEQRMLAALELFNATEHTRTVAGVARSLGAPTVAARATGPGGRVTIVVSWELCWYRYEVELDEEGSRVHQAAQGYELSELAPSDQEPNAVADEDGALYGA